MYPARTKVFVSYSHKDRKWLEQLRPYLDALTHERDIEYWADTRIKAGTQWRSDIESALLATKVAVLLVSQDFLNSEFISKNELPPLLDAAMAGGAVILPLHLTPSRVAHNPYLSNYQSVNAPDNTLSQMSKVQRQLLFVQLTERIVEIFTAAADSGLESAPPVSESSPPISLLASEEAGESKSTQASHKRRRLKRSSEDAESESREPGGASLWQRVSITSGSDAALRYHVTGVDEDFIVQPIQRALSDRLVERCVALSRFEPDMAAALFTLLVPKELRSILFSTGRTELLLDSESARFPWELLQDGESNLGPFALRGSIIRRLDISHRKRSRNGVGRALVIGDPVSNFPELAGAQREARDVAMLFRKGGYQVTEQIRGTAADAIAALLTQPHQVLHLAGHGVVDYVPRDATGFHAEASRGKVSGFILGSDVFFTSVEAALMREVPEMVFVNASFLGRLSDARDTGDRNVLAVSLGTQLLKAGVQAVVAPGWAIDDSAAIAFATSFYSAMLQGACFGDAAHAARKTTQEQHPKVNTWGAYQCYGDPEYKLHETGTCEPTK